MVPIKDIRDISGRFLSGPFEGLQSSGVYDLKEIARIVELQKRMACGGVAQQSVLEKVAAYFGPVMVEADQFCTGSSCTGSHWGPGTEACVPSPRGLPQQEST
jgi:hypothetical protein